MATRLRRQSPHRRIRARVVGAALLVGGPLTAPLALAQIYSYSPTNADEQQPGNVYFGAAKDDDGQFLAGVTVVLKTDLADFVLVTDEAGRFRMKLPADTKPADVTASCSRRGYVLVKAQKRAPRGQSLTPVEVNCVLREA
jgi:hypothetical protein